MSMIHGWYAGHAPFIRWTRLESPHSPNGEKGAGVYSSNGFPWTISVRATGHWGPPKCDETGNEAYFDLFWHLSFWMNTCQKTKQHGFTRCGMLFIFMTYSDFHENPALKQREHVLCTPWVHLPFLELTATFTPESSPGNPRQDLVSRLCRSRPWRSDIR